MRFRSKSGGFRILHMTCAAGLGLFTMTANLSGQDATPSSKVAGVVVPTTKIPFEVYSGFSYFKPVHSNLVTTFPDGSTVDPDYGSAHTGNVTSASIFFTKYFGAQIEAGLNPDGSNDGFWTGQGGLVMHLPSHKFQPFGHILVGETEVAGPNSNPHDIPYYHNWTWTFSRLFGGGVDYELPFYKHRFSVRLIQFDYQFQRVEFGHQTDGTGGGASISALQASSGLVWHPGWVFIPTPLAYACVLQPASVFPGDPVTVTGTATNLLPKKTPVYTWSGQGVTVKGDTATATIDTTGLSAGTYVVTGHVSEGPKAGMTADCSASLTVQAYQPPTVSCSADPSTIAPGAISTVTAAGVSPQNRTLTYSYSASGGSISGTGTTATLNSGGAPAGGITVTCNVADDKGQTASATTTVTVEAPAIPVAPKTSTLCSVSFERDSKRPARVDNEAKACLDSVALSAQGQADASLVVVGESTPAESEPAKVHGKKHAKMAANLAAQRAANTKAYLVTEKGIDASRIKIRTGSEGTQKAENYLVPSGATFENDVTGTTVVDESTVKPEARKPLGAAKKKHGKKHSSM